MPLITGLLFPIILFATIVSATRRGPDSLIGLVGLGALGVADRRRECGSNTAWLRRSSRDTPSTSSSSSFTILVILRHVFRDVSAGPDTILGSAAPISCSRCSSISSTPWWRRSDPGSFAGAIDVRHDGGYFSLVTLSTLGYGDMLPVRAHARSLAAIEAVLGQFYIAVIVARLVATRMAYTPGAGRSPRSRRTGRTPSDRVTDGASRHRAHRRSWGGRDRSPGSSRGRRVEPGPPSRSRESYRVRSDVEVRVQVLRLPVPTGLDRDVDAVTFRVGGPVGPPQPGPELALACHLLPDMRRWVPLTLPSTSGSTRHRAWRRMRRGSTSSRPCPSCQPDQATARCPLAAGLPP